MKVRTVSTVTLLLFAFLPLAATAQRVSMGVILGGYFNSDFNSRYEPGGPNGFPRHVVVPGSGGYVAGPSVEIRLSEQFSFEVDALYKPLHYQDAPRFENGVITAYAPNTVVTWQFPTLVRYRLPLRGLQPFWEAGPSFRSTGNLNLAEPSHLGISAGAGLEVNWRRVRLTPRVRYTRWRQDEPNVIARTRADQIELLVGASYLPAADTHPLGRRLSFGAVIGSTISPDVRTHRFTSEAPEGFATFEVSSGSRTIVAGPKFEFTLTSRLSVEANALPRSFRHVTKLVNVEGDIPIIPEPVKGSFKTWEFPLLLKYKFKPQSLLRPFIQLGPSFRLPEPPVSTYGGTVGAGVEIKLKMIKVTPAIRFSHWGPNQSGGSTILRNQVQILTGISF